MSVIITRFHFLATNLGVLEPGILSPDSEFDRGVFKAADYRHHASLGRVLALFLRWDVHVASSWVSCGPGIHPPYNFRASTATPTRGSTSSRTSRMRSEWLTSSRSGPTNRSRLGKTPIADTPIYYDRGTSPSCGRQAVHESLIALLIGPLVSPPQVITFTTLRFPLSSPKMCACLSPHRAPLTVLHGNDTLDDGMCANAGNSDAQTDAWLVVFAPPITARLNRWAPGANVTDAETYSLISMCPFHTVASYTIGQQTLPLSLFCVLFNADEFAAFEYSMDLDKYYGTGYGAYLCRVQGVGYINELLARLTHTPMTAIYAAIGLFPQAAPLDPTAAPAHMGTWVASLLRLACARGAQYVRVLLNDVAQPLAFCADKKTPGVCELGAFVRSQAYARGGGDGDWAKCFL
ncbi:histidine phosphatase superfamily [Mycena rosella]|uniref:Histidine phosphatase superfamily n=1 Tax=Mycena rosella TaxID=1033263 RepID=A0AAD7DAS4_MYCRO|nr:histidine phosphatase superfamily [Mycena rosella]